jgi:6-phosphogluconolactonase
VRRDAPDTASLARLVAGEIASRLSGAVLARGRATLIVPGGTSPGPLFDALSDADLPWADITVSLSDERWVDVENVHSNERLVRERLLQGRACKARLVSWRGAATDAGEAAGELSEVLRPMVPFDVCVLGLGLDGHIASLIPGAEGFQTAMRGDATVLAIHAPGAAGAADRLTLSFPAIAVSRCVVLLFSGEAKRAIFDNAMAGVGGVPIVRLLREAVHPVWACWSPEAKP